MRFLFSAENTENEILLFSFSGCFLFSFSLKMFSEHFHHRFLFSVKMKTENNQTKHPLKEYELQALIVELLKIRLYSIKKPKKEDSEFVTTTKVIIN